ncbi:MAG: transglutaminase domain-containing protein [Reyranella sp.]|uniref:transglutaminase-like domain-containing protein n=1 Tax=Reyranella sp. TaxID=1929291 RepID=UPI002731C39B|nr:transglutaminase domain-containing protein [Reyranella sp.]MDP1965646.1 transglutaminase domain-containing protein [Reyranella sp.]MDP2378724.1 transglutaminase domain-containing protein [Reyranella sp.]
MNRRDMFKAGVAACAIGLTPRLASAQATFAPVPKGWRTFVLIARVEPQNGTTKAWIPLPTFEAADWQRPGNVAWTGNARVAERVRDPKYGAEMLRVEWASDQQSPAIEVTAQVQTQNRAVRIGQQQSVAPLSEAERKLNLASTDLLPTDGLVKETAEEIVRGKKDDVAKARALYDWVVENTFRNAKTLGCGVGDIASMIKSGNLNGKCADLNALFVGLARSVGLPARDVYGIRVAPSEFGFKALGAGSEVVSKAQHCRAEVWLAGSGWTPVDPADVRKVVLEEPPANLAMTDPKVVAARRALFGSWEGNWVAFNVAHDVKLPGSKEPAIPFLMYPQAENKAGFLDSLDPDKFKYRITARELTA